MFQLSKSLKKDKRVFLLFLCICIACVTLFAIIFALVLPQYNHKSYVYNSDFFQLGEKIPVYNEHWKVETLSLLEKTHNWTEDTYDGALSQALISDPYTTYYATSTYQILNNTIPNRNTTVALLKASQQKDGSFPCEHPQNNQAEAQLDRMSCMYYFVMTLNKLGEQPNNKITIINHIKELQYTNGIYASNKFRQVNIKKNQSMKDLLPTEQALTMLKALDVQTTYKEILTASLISFWEENVQSKNSYIEKLPQLSVIANSLNLLGISIESLPNTKECLEWVVNLQSTILTLKKKETSQQTNLFFIDSWINLLSLLNKNLLINKLSNSSFSQELLKYQQAEGGFDVFLGNKPDIQGMYLAISFFKDANKEIPRKQEILSLLNRQAINGGGFASVNRAEPDIYTIVPTYISLHIRSMLGENVKSTMNTTQLKNYVTKCISILNDKSKQNGLFSPADMQNLYYTSIISKYLMVDTDLIAQILQKQKGEVINTIRSNRALNQLTLVDSYYLSSLLQFDGSEKDLLQQNLLEIYKGQEGFSVGSEDNLETTWLSLSELKNIGFKISQLENTKKLISYLYTYTSRKGGFEYKGVSNIYTSFFVIESLKYIEERNSNVHSLFANWLRSQELNTGGIAAIKGDLVPDLHATELALTLSQLINQPL